MELNDLTSRTAAGRLIQDIRIRDLTVGSQFPIIKTINIESVSLAEDRETFEKLDLLFDIDYRGGFSTSVDVAAVFGRYAHLAVTVTRLAGKARLSLTRLPYTHWSFAFVEMPLLDFKVESHLQGRPLKHLVPLIIQQFRRAVCRKHVLPNYKIRYRPMFPNPLLQPSAAYASFDHIEVVGGLQVTVLTCSRLNVASAPAGWTEVYCTISIEKRPYVHGSKLNSMHSISMSFTLTNHGGIKDDIGLTFSRSVAELGLRTVQVSHVQPQSQADKCGFKEGDTILAVNNVPIRNERHANRLINGTMGELCIVIERNIPDDNVNISNNIDENNVRIRTDSIVDEPGFVAISRDNSRNGCTQDDSCIRKTNSETNLLTLIEDDNRIESTLIRNNACPILLREPSIDLRRTRSASQLIATTHNTVDDRLSMASSTSPGGDGKTSDTIDDNDENASPTAADHLHIDRSRAGSRRERLAAKANEMAQKFQSGKDTVRDFWHRRRRETNSATPNNTNNNFEMAAEAEFDSGGDQSTDAVNGTGRLGTEVTVVDEAAIRSKSSRCNRPADDNNCKATKSVQLNENVLWGQSLHFSLNKSTSRYLNVTVWARIPSKNLDTPSMSTSSDGDDATMLDPVMLGYTSVYVPQLIDDCQLTLSNCHREVFTLRPPTNTTVPPPSDYADLVQHAGFDARLCFGDVTLGFRHYPAGLPQNASSESSLADRNATPNVDDETPQALQTLIDSTADRHINTFDPPPQHHWINIQLKRNATCAMCRGKVWLKSANQCTRCMVICHLKCAQKASYGIVCVPDVIDDMNFEV